MALPNELESRAVLLRAFPPPAAAELERAWSNVTLLRQRRPQLSRAGWSTAARIAAAIALLATGAGAGWMLRSPARAAVAVRPMPHLAVEPASVPTSIPFSGARGVRVRYWFFPYGGGRTLLEDRFVLLPAGHDLRISSADELVASDFSPPRFAADLVFHAAVLGNEKDSAVMVGANLTSALPAFGTTVPPARLVTEAEVRSTVVLRHNQSAWILPFHSSREAARGGTGLEVWLDRERADYMLPARTQGSVNVAPLVIETAPRIQGAALRIEVSDSADTWRTVFDRPHFLLSRGSGKVFIGGPYPRGHLTVVMQPPPFGRSSPLCFTWEWGDRRPPNGAWCFRDSEEPVVVPLHGSSGKRLRITLLQKYETLPF